jgi:capsular exopolysaccharide synthesis family protein
MFRSRRKAPKQPSDHVPDGVLDDALVIVDRAVEPLAVMFHEPTGHRAEQFRGLRNKLIAMNPDGDPKTLVVTSAIKGEGKTVCALNLALAFAELERHKILLVDADLRAPSLERALNLNPGPGLADLLLERCSFSEAVRGSGFANLDFLGPGSRVRVPSEVLASTRIEQLFERFKAHYQYVILDTPPVLAVTDASVLGARADGCLMTVRIEYSGARHSREAMRALEDLGGNVLGVFVTDVRQRDPDEDPRLSYGQERDDEEATWGG